MALPAPAVDPAEVDPPVQEPTPEPVAVLEERLGSLERRLRWLVLGLLLCIALIAGLGIVSGMLLQRHAVLLAQEKVRDAAQLRLLEQVRADFEAMNQPVPRNQIEAYGQLREQVNVLRKAYEPLADFDKNPEKALDRLLGPPGAQRRFEEKADVEVEVEGPPVPVPVE